MTLLDVSPLLALTWDGHAAHDRAQEWLESASTPLMVCRVAGMGLLRLLTIPAVLEDDVLTRQQAWATLDQLLSDERFIWRDEPIGMTAEFRSLSAVDDHSHKLWTDDYLAAFALASSASLTTLDRKFSARYPQLDVVVI